MTSGWAAAGFALFAWWFSTGIILLVVNRAERAGPGAPARAAWLCLPVLAIGAAGVALGRDDGSAAGAYAAFLSALAIWGWIELAFLTGVLTGPVLRPCPADVPEWERFVRAWGVIAYSEMCLVAVLAALWLHLEGAANPVALWTFATLFGARLTAKLNLWLGVPHVHAEMLPRRLSHVASHFRIRRPTPFFALSVTLLTLAAGGWTWTAATAETPVASVGAALVAALTALALVEHWLMVVPIPDGVLWRWTEARGARKPAP
ncbi:MAG: putative photosynthetic complex assembly protein PuhE [Albimonas sp.]|uniref:putative photosynthetic complex assembly protein PuhE n=1 Tax=Albimonas sp. TaxID=1872425 RepID=UPI004056D412